MTSSQTRLRRALSAETPLAAEVAHGPELSVISPPPPRPAEAARRFLMLKAPFGSFFPRLADALTAAGHTVVKVVFDAGDARDWGWFRPAIRYTGRMADWRQRVDAIFEAEAITDLVVLSDCVEPHRIAIAAAKARGVRVHVFEEGYFRPRWITLESDGVNGYSSLPRDPEAYRDEPADLTIPVGDAPVGSTTFKLVALITWHHTVKILMWPLYPSPDPAYSLPSIEQAWKHIVRYVRNQWNAAATEALARRIETRERPYFLGLLQRTGDSQLTCHSDYDNISFMIATAASFAAHAPKDARLVFKLHPLDPGVIDYEDVANQLAARHGLEGRLLFIDGGVLKSMAAAASGAVTVNSTAGLATAEFGCPTKVLGRAIYDMPGLTDQKPLDQFWSDPAKPDFDLFIRFRNRVMRRTQVNGSYYTPQGRALLIDACVQRLTGAQAQA